MKTPEEKRNQVKTSLRLRRKRLKKIGLCQDCGNNSKKRGHTLCIFCLDSRRRCEKARVLRKKST